MSETEGLEIRQGGRLFKTKWVYNKKEKKGRYVHEDVTDRAISMLFDSCSLEDGVTLRDVLLLLNTQLDMFDLVLGNWCKDIVEEGLKGPPKEKFQPDLEFLDLYFGCEIHDGVLSGYAFPDFHGEGFIAEEDKHDKWGHLEVRKGDRQSWAIEFTPVNELAPVKLRLNEDFTVHDWDKLAANGYKHVDPLKFKASFTLGHILYGILWELSFCGSPKMRQERLDDLNQRIKDVESGKVKTIPWEDVKKDLKEKPKKDKKK